MLLVLVGPAQADAVALVNRSSPGGSGYRHAVVVAERVRGDRIRPEQQRSAEALVVVGARVGGTAVVLGHHVDPAGMQVPA